MDSISSLPTSVAIDVHNTTNPGIPLRSAYSWTVHALLLLATGVFVLTEAVVADGSNPHPHANHVIFGLAVPYVVGFFIYFAFPRGNMLGCVIRLVYDELNIVLGFALVISIYTNFSDTKYMIYMIFWFSVMEVVRIAYLFINQFCDFVGREKPIPF